MSHRVLLVDDDHRTLLAYQRTLGTDFPADTVMNCAAALQALQETGPYSVVVADMHMPERSGLELLVEIRRRFPDIVRVMLTGAQDQATAANAVNSGRVFCFLAKPCAPAPFLKAIGEAVEEHRKIRRDREILEQTFNGVVQVFTEILASVEPDSFALGQRMRERTRELGKALQVPWTWELEAAAMLLRVGTVTIPPAVLVRHRAREPLRGAEADLIARIPELGARMVEHIPRLAAVADMLRYQEKGFDGSGGPKDDVRGDEIPMGARVLRAVADLQRLEDSGLPAFVALGRMKQDAQLYDAKVLDALETIAAGGTVHDADLVLELTMEDVRPAMVLADDVLSHEGVPLVKKGTKISPTLLERLRNFSELGHLREPINVLASPQPAVVQAR